MKDYAQVNQDLWNKRTDVHFDSDFYDNNSFLQGKSSLNSIELDLLGEIKGKSVLHAQCHFGQDSLSLARMGADVTAFDLSDKAIEKAKELSQRSNLKAKFVQSEYYESPQAIKEQFDIFFTTYGVLGWLPDMKKWAKTAYDFTKDGGELILVEFHPFVWIHDDDFSKIAYDYFMSDPIIEETENTYTNKDKSLVHEFVSWNHSLGEVMSALIDAGFTIADFQ